ncbi:MAG TPA: hypothetical protein DCE27_05385 [Xanthomarina gelatinilytica]|jgi:hypothetical protein|nr:hypothetical protein [Xanthomarina gelatinilytica]|tara:strand:- start:322 stop:516 length:195 start_codon:yes stop_codon:yes gene_type:complete
MELNKREIAILVDLLAKINVSDSIIVDSINDNPENYGGVKVDVNDFDTFMKKLDVAKILFFNSN